MIITAIHKKKPLDLKGLVYRSNVQDSLAMLGLPDPILKSSLWRCLWTECYWVKKNNYLNNKVTLTKIISTDENIFCQHS